MKIKKVKWNNHPILGNLELDFMNSATGEPFDTVLIAGENGTGKTTILETMSTFLNIGSFEYFDYLEYIVDGAVYKATPLNDASNIKDFFSILDNSGTATTVRANRNNNRNQINTNKKDPRYHGCVFSKARADYKTQEIQTTTTKALDIDKYDNDKEDDFTSLKQLIVDIDNQDNSEYAETNKGLGKVPKSWDEFYKTSKISRFKNAFDGFFGNIEYERVTNVSQEKLILFKKNGKSIPIDKLSTGEKQIVFRGTYLLKNSGKLDGAAIMVDEPELSMHPKWQKKILQYYKQLFTKGTTQAAQLFIATHSEYVLEDALSNKNANLVIVLNDVAGVIQAKRIDAPSVLPSITSAETNYLAFDIVSNDYHIELYGYLQYKHGLTTVKLCDDYIKAQPAYNAAIHNKPSNFGRTTYDTLCTYIRNLIDHPDPTRNFTDAELRTSTELLIELCR